MAPKKRKTVSKPALPPPPQNPRKFVMKATEDDYPFFSHTPFFLEKGFTSIAINFFDLLKGRRNWNQLCEHPPLGVAPVVCEFCTNLRYKIGLTVFVRGTWLPFDYNTINQVFGLNDEDSEEFKALYREPDYEKILQEFTDGKSPWSRTTKQEIMFFPRIRLTKIAKAWFHLVSNKLIPSKHVFIVRRDKVNLTYAIVKGYKFNVGKIIKNSILEVVYGKAITHPSLITKLCEIAGVQIGENEEKCPPMHPLPFPQKKKTHLSRHNISGRTTEEREEEEDKEEENQLDFEPLESEEEETEREPLQAQIDLVVEIMSGMAKPVYEEFIDSWKRNALLHRDNDQIYARMDALAQR